jgi:hypothetical protein
MDEWVTEGIKPPRNTLPRLKDRTVGDWTRRGSGFPAIPGVNYPGWAHEPPIFDIRTIVDGVLTEVPIPFSGFYPAYTPKVDRDGNEIAGIRTPDIKCPIGTHTGWVLRATNLLGAGTPIRNGGGYIPFAKTRAERLAAGDPRRSLEERYDDHRDYMKCVEKAARKAMRQRFILPEAVQDYIDRAQAREALFTGFTPRPDDDDDDDDDD